MSEALSHFRPATRDWFAAAFEKPTLAQAGAWDVIAGGANALVIAPTGSGKTLSAFLWSLDRLLHRDEKARSGVSTLYISPLKALAVDVERNLRAPLAGIRAHAARRDTILPEIGVGIRSGDTPAIERRRMVAKPPDILITTPESLYLLLTSKARETLRTVDTVIIDEVHAVAGTKRGSHLALSLERLDALLAKPAQRIGLSATVRPPDEIARFLGGQRPVEIVSAHEDKILDISVVVPVEDLAALRDERPPPRSGNVAGEEPTPSIWPHVETRVLELIKEHHSTIVFANSRRLAERFCGRLNELAGEEVARAHHGSVSREQRTLIEESLKSGDLPAVVATSSLELGIDMGAVDLVVQIESPDSVASGLQRIGRAGHQVGAASRGIVFPKFRGDLLEAAVVSQRMSAGQIEEIHFPQNPLDVLAQQIVAMVAIEDWTVDDIEAVVRRAAPYADLQRNTLERVLDMLAGRYPSDAFAGLRARINWDRVNGQLSSRPGSHNIAVTSGGTIPDRGLFGVFIAGDKRTRVGELDEEMVYESRAGEVFVLGASSWRIEEITADRVLVSPAAGQPGKMPFWHGDAPGRPIELGRAIGAFIREVGSLDDADRFERLGATGCDALAARNLAAYLDDQKASTGILPDDRTIVVERFRDAVGDWRLCLHSFFGARVHAPWAQAISARLRQRLGIEIQVIYSDDGIVVRVPDGDELPSLDTLLPDPTEIEDLVVNEVGNSTLFASRFREAAARALLLPRKRPGARTPLWLQRQKAATLLQIAARHDTFPIVLETYRECLRDVFDLPALIDLLGQLERREVQVVEVETDAPSPFASSLQLAYVGAFMYDGDAPLAEKRAQALALDRSALAEIMGREELRDLLDAGVLADLEIELQRLTPERRARHADDLHDLLRELGAYSTEELRDRVQTPTELDQWLAQLESTRRAVRVRYDGEDHWIAIEDAGLYRDALGAALPLGIPTAFLELTVDPLTTLVARFARCNGPFDERAVAARLRIGPAVALEAIRKLEAAGRVVQGEFRPGGSGREWIDSEVLRRLRRRSLAALRREIEPVSPEALGQLSVAWHDIGPGGPRLAGIDGLVRVIEQLQGAPLAASILENQIMPARLSDYSPAALDQLGSAGEVLWTGAGAIGTHDGWIVLAQADCAALLLPEPIEVERSALADKVLAALDERGASFFRQISEAVGGPDDAALLLAIWELVWSGHVTNDTLAPLRALLRTKPLKKKRQSGGRVRQRGPSRLGPMSGAGRWSVRPLRSQDATRRRHAVAEQLLVRHGVVTRGAITVERIGGGFSAVYPLLTALEERGSCRRGYFVEGLGGAQFALPGAVDRMRTLAADKDSMRRCVVLAATDPANPYGAALAWPQRGAEGTHRAGRKAGSVVVLVGGHLALYVERGGRTMLSYPNENATGDDSLLPAIEALAAAARKGFLGRFEVELFDGEPVAGTSIAEALEQAGFVQTYRGYELRA